MEEDDTRGAEELTERLAEIRRLQATTRRSLLTEGWQALLLWGALFLASVPAAYWLDGNTMWYWIVGGAVGGATSWIMGSRAEVHPDSSARPYLAVAVVMFVGAFGSFQVFEGRQAILSWWAVLLIGFILFSLLDGQRALAVAMVVMVIWGIVIYGVIEDEGALYAVLASGLGAALVGAGAAFRTVR